MSVEAEAKSAVLMCDDVGQADEEEADGTNWPCGRLWRGRQQGPCRWPSVATAHGKHGGLLLS